MNDHKLALAGPKLSKLKQLTNSNYDDGRVAKRTSPAAARNLGPIVQVLREWLPERGRVLEIASGSGEHAIGFAAAFPGLQWQPSDASAEALASIDAWAAEAALTNLGPALRLDVTDLPWPVKGPCDAIVCINMIHIAPWSACLALMQGAGELLRTDGRLYVYGPMKIGGEFTSASNAEFNESLRSRDPDWGVRDLEAVAAAARAHGLELVRTVAMPANNHSLLLRRT